MCEQNLALNNQQCLICHKTQPTKPKIIPNNICYKKIGSMYNHTTLRKRGHIKNVFGFLCGMAYQPSAVAIEIRRLDLFTGIRPFHAQRVSWISWWGGSRPAILVSWISDGEAPVLKLWYLGYLMGRLPPGNFGLVL